MIKQIVYTLRALTYAGGWIRPCSEHIVSLRVVFCDSAVRVSVIVMIYEVFLLTTTGYCLLML